MFTQDDGSRKKRVKMGSENAIEKRNVENPQKKMARTTHDDVSIRKRNGKQSDEEEEKKEESGERYKKMAIAGDFSLLCLSNVTHLHTNRA